MNPRLVSAMLGAVALAFTMPARADEPPTLSGSWTATSLSERWAIGDWGEACGPKPQPQGAAGGAVQIRQQGSELSISGAGRAWTTAQCWEQMPGLGRTNHSGGQRGWSTRCSTAANDPRRATVITTTQATDTSITMTETGQYRFAIQDQVCTASVTRSRSYRLVAREGGEPSPIAAAPPPTTEPAASAPSPVAAAPASAAPTPAPPPEQPCATPGEPARLEVFPSRKLLRSGERFGFRATVLDAAGCRVAARPSWSLAPGPVAAKASVDASGVVTVADDAPEGKLALVVGLQDKGVTVTIEVSTPEHYDALLATSGLNAAGEAEASAIAVIATATVGGSESRAVGSARERKQLFLLIVGAVAAALAMVGLVLRRRGNRPAIAPRDEDEASVELPVASSRARAPVPTAPRVEAPRPKGKICRTCGQRYGAESSFCGRDGTSLVRLN